MLISILKLTRQGPVSHEVINKNIRMPTASIKKLLRKLQNDGLANVQDDILEVSDAQRMRLAVLALKMGGDIERVSSLLQWKEFEGMAAVAFEHNGYSVVKNLHFKQGGRKWEIDVVGCKKPLVVCADCKHWHHGLYQSALEKIVKEQVARVHALIKSIPNPAIKIGCAFWSSAKFVPVILSLIADKSKFRNGVPVVPILQLQDFLNQLQAYAGSILCLTSADAENPSSDQTHLF